MTMEPDSSWLEERLFERRIVLCRGVLDDALAGRVAAELMTLDALGDGAVELQLDSERASLEAAWTLIDVIDLLGVPVNIVCSGRVEGAAVGVLTAGGRRTALATCSVPPERSRARDLRPGERARLPCSITTRRVSNGCTSGSPPRPAVRCREVAADFRAGRSLDAIEALRYRLIDEIAGDSGPIRSIGSSAVTRSTARGPTAMARSASSRDGPPQPVRRHLPGVLSPSVSSDGHPSLAVPLEPVRPRRAVPVLTSHRVRRVRIPAWLLTRCRQDRVPDRHDLGHRWRGRRRRGK